MKSLREGQYVKHFQYGFGIVTESDPERTSIDFDAHGLKKFVTSIMVVELAGEAPPRAGRARRPRKAGARVRVKKPAEAVPVGEK